MGCGVSKQTPASSAATMADPEVCASCARMRLFSCAACCCTQCRWARRVWVCEPGVRAPPVGTHTRALPCVPDASLAKGVGLLRPASWLHPRPRPTTPPPCQPAHLCCARRRFNARGFSRPTCSLLLRPEARRPWPTLRKVQRGAPRAVPRAVPREAPREAPREVPREAQREAHKPGQMHPRPTRRRRVAQTPSRIVRALPALNSFALTLA